MKEIPLHEARNSLSALVAEIEASGESVIVTCHGKPAARLSSAAAEDRGETRATVARRLIEQLERDTPLADGPSWEELESEMDADRP